MRLAALIVVGTFAAMTTTPVPARASITAPPRSDAPRHNVEQIAHHCGPGHHWVARHKNHAGHWVSGHCVTDRH